MAVHASKTVQVEEEIEGDRIETSDYFFSKIGEAVPLMSDGSGFDIQSPPGKPLVVSERFGLIFAVHSSGFCLSKTKDVIASAKGIKDKGSGPSVQGLSVIDVPVGKVHILALSLDSSVLAAAVGQDIHCFLVSSLIHKDTKPFSSCSVGSDHVKDLIWVKDIDASFVVLTDGGKLYFGAPNKSLKDVMEEVDAVGTSCDGNFVAVARKSTLSIYSSEFKEMLHILLPLNSWMGDNTASCTIKVDSIRWVRSDSIVLGCLQLSGDSEENYFVQVIKTKEKNIVYGSSTLAAVCFSDVFSSIIDDIVPFGCGPHLFMEYLDNCELAFVSNRKNTEQHIMLFAWSRQNNQVSVVDIDRDTWLPRIELQENGDDNLVLGLCIDKTSLHENVNIKLADEEQRVLRSHCLFLCLTLEGKLIMFNVASSTRAFSALSCDAQVPVVGPSNIGKLPLTLEETAKKSAITSGSHELSAKKISFGYDDKSARKDLDTYDVKKHFTSTTESDESWRKESIAGDSKGKASIDFETCKAERPGHTAKGSMSQFSLKDSPGKDLSSVGGYVVGTELPKIEHDQSILNKLPDFGKSIVEKTGTVVAQSTSFPLRSTSSMAIPNLSDGKSPLVSPSATRNTLPGSVLTSIDTSSSAGNIVGKSSSRSSDICSSSIGKSLNNSQIALSGGGFTDRSLGISTSKVHPRESVAVPNPIGDSRYALKENWNKSLPFGQPKSEQDSSKQYCNVQNMASELDKLLECIEEAGGFMYSCTTAQRTSLETLEEGMKSISDRTRAWQSFTEERLREVQVLLDKTVQVLAWEKHMEGIVRQSTDEHYLDLWIHQKLSSELDLKQQNLSNRSQDLINQMIELEKHFNALELNLFGDRSAVGMSSRGLQCRSTSSRHIQSVHAVHSATMSQLAAAVHLSEFLSRQMAALNVKSLPGKQEGLKKKLFESIGISDPVDYCLGSASTGKKVERSTKKTPFVFSSGAVHKESRRNLMTNLGSHEPETARRRRDSLDRNWANFEAPRTTVKRMLIENGSHNASSSFSLMDSQRASLHKLQGSTATYPKILDMQGCKDAAMKVDSENVAASMFKSSGAISVVSQAELSPRLQVLPGNNFSASGEQSASSSPLSSFSLPASLVDPNMNDSHNPTAKGRGAQIGHIDKSVPAFTEGSKSSGPQPVREKLNTQIRLPQLPSSAVNGDDIPVAFCEETPLRAAVGGRSPLIGSAHDAQSSPASGFSSISTLSRSASIVPSSKAQSSTTSVEDGSLSSAKMVKDVCDQVLQRPSFASSVSSICAETSVVSTPQPCQKLEPSPNNGLRFESAPAGEVPKQEPSGSPLALSRTATLASDMVQNTQPGTISMAPPLSWSDSAGKNFGDAPVSHEDEMEEEAPETNQTVDLSLGSLGGFETRQLPSGTASRSNPFGGPMTSAPVSLTVPSGELFRPASLSFQPLQAPQQSQPSNIGGTTSVFGSGNPHQQPPTGSGFGQPGQIGLGQHALGSVLGSFGQSRQLGSQLPNAGFGGSQTAGGFLSASSSGGFAGVSAAAGGGGFAGIRTTASGFAVAAASGGGFPGAAASGGVVAGSANMAAGFGAFSKQGTNGFPAVGPGIGGGGRPASDLFTQIRK